MHCDLCITLKFPWEEHWHLHGLRTLCGCVFSLGIEHYAAFACPAPIVVSYIYDGESAHFTRPAAEITYEVGQVCGLSCLILHCALSVDDDAYRHAVAIAHEGISASYSDAAYGA